MNSFSTKYKHEIDNCSFRPWQMYLKYLNADKMRGKVEKSIWNIWKKIKWEPRLENLNWPLSMGLNQLCNALQCCSSRAALALSHFLENQFCGDFSRIILPEWTSKKAVSKNSLIVPLIIYTAGCLPSKSSKVCCYYHFWELNFGKLWFRERR